MREGHNELRMLALAPTEKDAALTARILGDAGIEANCFLAIRELCAELDDGAGALLLPEEVLAGEEQYRLAQWMARQPPWSDLPVLVLARHGADSEAIARAMGLLGNVTVLERPTRVAALVSAARSALRARRRQYEIRRHLAERERNEEALRTNDRRKDEFLAILAHELRNPLAPIRNSLFILHNLEEGGSSPEIAKLAAMMERQVNHMVRLVDDLLEISRITRDKIDLRKERVELEEVVRAALEASRPQIDTAGHRVEMDLPVEGIFLDADPVRLAQVLANLLNNAAKYTDSGGQIWLRVRRAGPVVEIAVRDNGTGIAREMLPRVFDLFTQVAQSPTRAQGGLGIGLTLVKRLVEMHGGSVDASSEGIGRGSEFTVRLPVAAAGAAAGCDDVDAVSIHDLAGRRVMVVDDNVDAADSLGALLDCLGVETRVVYDGAAAIEALSDFQPAVVLLDIGMPGMDGHEVARRIRQQPLAVTLIAMTGWGQDEDRRRSREAGFDYHLVKPADVHALGTLLRSIEERSHAGMH
ncbi:MAG TPA: ATP-binding protein [Candidatus Binatia bacterium]|jgi:signal transduction histidine kinase/ActR/RegA family two-component response regulator